MIIVGRAQLGGTSGTGNGGSLTTVKTDGATITGDGNTTPLALGPGEKDSIGGYVLAKIIGGVSGINYGQIFAGGYLSAASYHPSYGIVFTGNTLPGAYRCCCTPSFLEGSMGLYIRVA
ncbi:hypothetical protein E2M45_02080 [Salmonella enterica subsp. enterica serovar Newport]|nr:hypothetical protein [Salmonella enterica subsp. enterica serovar Newport]